MSQPRDGALGAQVPHDILLVEDNAADASLLQSVFRQLGMTHRLHIVVNGLDALAFLKREAPFESAPRPALVLLDLNLPKLPGRDVISRVKADADLRTIPLMVFSSSAADIDVQESYERGANAYLVKPFELQELVKLVKITIEFWLTRVLLAPVV